jgi:hypothetical protein
VRRVARVIKDWAREHSLGVAICAALAGIVALWFFFDIYLAPEGFSQRVEAIKAAQSLATFSAVVIGGIWAYVKVVRRREHAPRVDFTVDVGFMGEQRRSWLIDVRAFINNEGLVRHTCRELNFELRCLYEDDHLVDGDDAIGRQTLVPHVLKRGSWLPHDWDETFIEPGLRTRYSYVTSLPQHASFVLLHGFLVYGDGRIEHTAECLVKVPAAGEPERSEISA